jgi:L-asparaginase II
VNVHPPSGPEFVDVTRGPLVESVHRIAACAIDADGTTLLEIGETDVPVYMRSAAKPFIAAAIVREGVVERFGLDGAEIAIVAASHNGEPGHVATVRSILAKAQIPESALQCGAHPPYDPAAARELERNGVAPSAIHNNCSGKHAGILAMCKVLGYDLDDYLSPRHPAQVKILDLCARVAGEARADMPLAIDGCGIPVYATTLRRAAKSFATLAQPAGIDGGDARALLTVRDAMRAHPWHVAGTGEFDTALMSHAPSVVAKAGAEGVHGAAFVGSNCGLVLKVLDGAARAVPPAAIALMRSLGVLTEAELERLEAFEAPVLRNRAGREVGGLEVRGLLLQG